MELWLGSHGAAYLRPLWSALTAAGWGEPSVWPIVLNEIEALSGLGELELADAFLAELEDRRRRLDSPWALSQAAGCRGLLLAATGALDDALRHSATALRELRRAWPATSSVRERSLPRAGRCAG